MLLYNYYFQKINTRFGNENLLLDFDRNKPENSVLKIKSVTKESRFENVYSLKKSLCHIFNVEYGYHNIDLGKFLNKVDILENIIN